MTDNWIIPSCSGTDKKVSQFNIPSDLFHALQNVDIVKLNSYPSESLGTVALPFLTKLLLNSDSCRRNEVIKILYPIRKTNDMIQLVQVDPLVQSDFVESDNDVQSESDFERATPRERLRMVAIEYRRIQELARKTHMGSNTTSTQNVSVKYQESWLFDNSLYIQDVALCLFALLNKPTTLPVINIEYITEALLQVANGLIYILFLVTNMPERCHEVYQSLIAHGDKFDSTQGDEVSDQRARTLRQLCRMNPQIRFRVRTQTIQMNLMPSLTIMTTIDHLGNYDSLIGVYDALCPRDNEEVNYDDWDDADASYDSSLAFILGILLSDDENTRSWFAHYIKSAQNHSNTLSDYRQQIVSRIELIMAPFLSGDDPDDTSPIYQPLDAGGPLLCKVIQATSTLRYFCALRGIGALKLNPQESELVLSLITCRLQASQVSVNFATVGVCTLLVCSSMWNGQKEERRAAEWLKWLIKDSQYSDRSYLSHGRCSISELLLLIAIHFQNNQTNQIAELVCATLGMKLQIKTYVGKCKYLFIQEVFTDQMIAEHAVKVPVTPDLNDNMTEFLPLHCIHQLLENRSFSKHQVPIEDWIHSQICCSRKPIHHMLPKLIEAYVNSVIVSTSIHGRCGTNQPIDAKHIEAIFKKKLYSAEANDLDKLEAGSATKKRKRKSRRDKSPERAPICDGHNGDSTELNVVDYEVAQVLTLYYLLLYDDVRLRKGGDLPPSERSKLLRYGSDLMMEIPVFYLIQLTRDNQDMFGAIYPYLLRLVASQYPHLCSIQHWLNTTDHYEPYNSGEIRLPLKMGSSDVAGRESSKQNGRYSNSHLSDLQADLTRTFNLVHKEPAAVSRVIHDILQLPRNEAWTFVDTFMENWHHILNLGPKAEHQKLSKSITRLWWKLNSVFPRRLWIMTTNSLRRSQSNKVSPDEARALEYSWNELTSDPLIVLRCDSRVFRCPPVLDIVLHILTGFLAAARRYLQDQIYEQTGRQTKDNRNLEELRATLVLSQTSAAIQILLEYCIPDETENELILKNENNGELTEDEKRILDEFNSSVDCVCEHLHQVFIADTNLAKLVHFQTYPSELLSTTSNKIPSMHICLDFIPELLSQPDFSKQVFVIELTSHLCEKYAITKSLNVAKLCFNVAFTLLQLLPSDKRALFYIPALPALLRICKVFPILLEDARMILSQINQITIAHLASTSSRLSLNSTSPCQGLEKMSWHEVYKSMRNLNLDEALFLCIQKCILESDTIQQ